MLLGYALREENGIWQDSLGLDNSFGLKGQLGFSRYDIRKFAPKMIADDIGKAKMV